MNRCVPAASGAVVTDPPMVAPVLKKIPGACAHSGTGVNPSSFVQLVDAAAAESGHLREGVELAASVHRRQRPARGHRGRARETPGRSGAVREQLPDERVERDAATGPLARALSDCRIKRGRVAGIEHHHVAAAGSSQRDRRCRERYQRARRCRHEKPDVFAACPSSLPPFSQPGDYRRGATLLRSRAGTEAPRRGGVLPSRLECAGGWIRPGRPSADSLRTCFGDVARPGNRKAPFPGLSLVGGTGLEPVTPSLSSWCSPN